MSDSVSELLERLTQRHPATIDLSLERMHALLAALGNPQHHLPPVVHVAGTNGKGSLIAYLTAMAKSAGLRAHRYISPHLVRFHERIMLDHHAIGDGLLRDVLGEVEHATRTLPATFFESTTAAAFLAFAREPADILLLEVGLGGRLDATNVIDRPLLTAITPVSMDHTEYLGDSLEQIAREKAGILKVNVPCVVGPQDAAAEHAIEREAKRTGSPLLRFGEEWKLGKSLWRKGFVYRDASGATSYPLPNLPGDHQLLNAATAVACARALGWNEAAIREGLVSAHWPGRLQRLTHGPLPSLLPPGSELWLDGGHNPSAGQALARWLKSRGKPRFSLIAGMIEGKDSVGYFSPLAPYLDRVYTVRIPGEKTGQSPEKLKESAELAGLGAEAMHTIHDALSARVRARKGPVRVVIAGSLYLAGTVLQENY